MVVKTREEIEKEIKESHDFIRDIEMCPNNYGYEFGDPEIKVEISNELNRIKKLEQLWEKTKEAPENVAEFDMTNINNLSSDKEIMETVSKFDILDYTIGLDIEELKDDPIHNILRNSPIYQYYYALWRLETWGNYKWIPITFLVWLQAWGSHNNKIIMDTGKDENNKLNLFGWKASGGGKSHLCDFMVRLLEAVDTPASSLAGPTTVADLRGTFDTEGGKCEFAPGKINRALLCFEEAKVVYSECQRDASMKGLFLHALEKPYIDAGTAGSKRFIGKIKDSRKAPKKPEQQPIPGTIDDLSNPMDPMNDFGDPMPVPQPAPKKGKKGKEEVQKTPIPLETESYSIKNFEQEGLNEYASILFKNNANYIILGQPILKDAGHDEKTAQKKFGFEHGFFYRGFFFWDKMTYNSEKEKRYLNENTTYVKKMKAKLNIENEKEIKVELINRLKKLLNEYPTRKYEIFTGKMSGIIMKFPEWNPDWDTVVKFLDENKTNSTIQGYIHSYKSRMQTKYIPYISFMLAYLNGKTYPNEEIFKTALSLGADSVIGMQEYIELATESPSWSKYQQVADYTKPIVQFIKHLYMTAKHSSQGEVDVVNLYPTKAVFDKQFPIYMKGLKFDEYNRNIAKEALQSLIDLNKILVTNTHPETGKGFQSNTYKIILLKNGKPEVI